MSHPAPPAPARPAPPHAVLRVFIAEDEAPACARLAETLRRVAPHAQVAGTAASVRDTATWLASQPAPDLLLLDIQLADGLSLELFRDRALACPVIFTTAYDRFVMDAFQAHAIDYLLKPVQDAQLAAALDKLARWRSHFAAAAPLPAHDGALHGHLAALLAQLGAAPPRLRQRVLGRKGAQHHAVPLDEVAYFVSDARSCFVVTTDARRLQVDEALSDIERELDPQAFFRLNRQVVAHARAIVHYTSAGKGRLAVELRPRGDGTVQVSQERAAALRAWLAR